jgi:hypothetical protein
VVTQPPIDRPPQRAVLAGGGSGRCRCPSSPRGRCGAGGPSQRSRVARRRDWT